MRTGHFLPNAIPGETITIQDLTLSCAICGTISQMRAVGYTLAQNDEEKKEGSVRFVLKHISGEKPLNCDCLLPLLEDVPIVKLYSPVGCAEFN
jgi:hypothetical protein